MRRAKLLSAFTLKAKLEFGAQKYSITDIPSGASLPAPQSSHKAPGHLLRQTPSHTHNQADPLSLTLESLIGSWEQNQVYFTRVSAPFLCLWKNTVFYLF